MDTGTVINGGNSSEEESNFKLYKYRWLILFLFCLYASINFLQYFQYSIITNIIARYYDMDTFDVSWASTVFMISYVVFFIPASYLMEKYDLRNMSILSTSLTASGAALKLFSVSPNRYYIVLIGQILCAMGQVFVLSLPSQVAAVWFGKGEVSTACAIAVLGTQAGVAIGSVVPPYVIDNHDDTSLIGEELFRLIMAYAILAYSICLIVVLFFEAKPPTPPSYAQLIINRPEITYLKTITNLLRNRDYVLLLIAMGVSNGIWNAVGVGFNTMYLNYFPNQEEDAGLLILICVISGGCIGSLIFGYILDKTHRFKLVSFGVLFLSSVMFFLSAIVLERQLRIGTFIAVALFGFFLASSIVTGYEFSVEVTYPEHEATTLAFLNAVILSFGWIFSVIIDQMYTSIGFFWSHITIATLLFASSLVIIPISTNLRRLQANRNTN